MPGKPHRSYTSSHHSSGIGSAVQLGSTGLGTCDSFIKFIIAGSQCAGSTVKSSGSVIQCLCSTVKRIGSTVKLGCTRNSDPLLHYIKSWLHHPPVWFHRTKYRFHHIKSWFHQQALWLRRPDPWFHHIRSWFHPSDP